MLLFLLLCTIVTGWYYTYVINRAVVEVEIDVEEAGYMKIYWQERAELPFTEKKHVRAVLSPEKKVYYLTLFTFSDAAKIRIDPMDFRGIAKIHAITIRQKGYETIRIDLSMLKPLHDITTCSVDNGTLTMVAEGKDPNFLYIPELQRDYVGLTKEIPLLLLLCGVAFLVSLSFSGLKENYGYIPFLLVVVLGLVVAMAAISKPNIHPDEYVHLSATRYYQSNWLPPRVDDPAIEKTYSIYGNSRLNNGEIYYLFAGKTANIFKWLNVPELFSLRAFNIVLLAFIVLYASAVPTVRPMAIVFLISPQIWYVFSYCCSDAFALFICFIAACELIRKESVLNRYLEHSERIRGVLFPVCLLGVMIGMLLLLKKNYYPFIVFFYVFLGWRLFVIKRTERGSFLLKLVMLTVMALMVAGFRISLDYYVNGLDRNEKLLEMEERLAQQAYKPSTPLDHKYGNLFQKARGVPLRDLIVTQNWFEKTLYSAFGVYGYTNIIASDGYYRIVSRAAALFLVVVCLLVLLRGGLVDSLFLVGAVGLSVALVGVSLYHSWTMDFQPQGRYLFPILPMFAIVLGRGRAYMNSPLAIIGMSQLFLLALYSFIFIALVGVANM